MRCERLKDFCDNVEVEYHNILSSGNTRWLSLLPAVERIIALFEPLKSFFLSEAKCPVVLKNFFEDPLSELWLWFIHNQLVLFNAAVLNMEGDNTSVINTTDELQKLTEKLHSRKTEKFISIKVKSKLKELEKKGIATDTFMQALNIFYETAIEYLSLWQASFKPFQQFLWTNLTAVPAWPDIEVCLETFFAMSNPVGIVIDDNILFDEVTNIKNFITDEKLKEWLENKTSVDAKFSIFSDLKTLC